MWKSFTDKLYGLDTLRDTAYADKERSKTRLFFTLLIFGGAIAAFVILFVYKATHRSIIVKTENAPDYKKYTSLYKSNGDSLVCTSSKQVRFTDLIKWDPMDYYGQSIDDYCDAYFSTSQMLYDACDDASYNLATALYNYKFVKGTFKSEMDLSEDFYDLIFSTSDDTYGTAWSIWNDIQSSLGTLTNTGGLAVNNYGAFNSWNDLITLALNDTVLGDADINGTQTPFTFSDAFYVTNEFWTDAAFTDKIVGGPADDPFYEVDLDFEKYFNSANVETCTYNVREGWFDVFIFALNSTQSLFGAAVIVFGFLFSLVKYCQGKCCSKSEGRDEDIELPAK